MSKYKKPLLLTGAGFATIWNAPSTADITTYIRNAPAFKTITEQPVGDWFYHKLCNVYHQDKDSVNFELILNYVENLYGYFQSKYHRGSTYWKNALYTFLKEDQSLYEILEFNRIYSRNKNSYKVREHNFYGDFKDFDGYFNSVYRYFVQSIYEAIITYTSNLKIEQNSAINNYLIEFIDCLRIDGSLKLYSTNYDRNIPQLIEGVFHEGFSGNEKNSKGYNPHDVLAGQNLCFYNLHGSIFHKHDFHEGFIISDDINPQLVGTGHNRDQESRVMLNEEIITGLNKASGILRSPFSEYYHRFYQDCMESDVIIVAGYSFGDTHINNALITSGKFNPTQQLRIIDYLAISEEKLMDRHEDDWVDHIGKYGRNFIGDEHPFYKILTPENDLNFKIFRKGMAAFLERKEWESAEF